MNLDLSDDQRLLVESFATFFRAESTPARIRAAQPLGFDPQLWKGLSEMGAVSMRNDGFSLHDAALVLEEAGRALASAPLAEAIAATRLLGALDDSCAREWKGRSGDGRTVVTLALHEAVAGTRQLVPGGAVADAIVCLSGSDLVLLQPRERSAVPPNLAGLPLAEFDLCDPTIGTRHVLARGEGARRAYFEAREEWKLLTAAALTGLSRQALQMAASYAVERIQFGRPIGTYQAISHPLADLITDTDGAQLLVWRAIRALVDGEAKSGAYLSMAYWWAARTAGDVVARALHVFGGYGLSIEYDIHLYHLRAKAWPLMLGDPEQELLEAGRRYCKEVDVALPPAGPMTLDFRFGPEAQALADETRRFFAANLTPELRAKAHFSFDGYDEAFSRALGDARLLYPSWPVEYGGRGTDSYAAAASLAVWDEFDWSSHAQGTTNMVGQMVIQFGSPELRAEVLPRISRGESICSLGYSEPASGSDVFAARTSAVRDGDDWIVNGQKMFTSGANIADYVLLLTRTDPEAAKHRGITLFLVPLKSAGIDIRPIFTFQDERTNTTFYADVHVPDRYRLGPVNGGLQVMTAVLEIEQGGGGFIMPHRRVLAAAVAWARATVRQGSAVIDDPMVLTRLARVATRVEVSEVLFRRSLWATAQRQNNQAHGPMSKLFATEGFLRDSTDLLDLAAPDSLLRGSRSASYIEQCHRHATATTIYGGTSEVHRSLIAEKTLGLPRSRL